MAQYENKGDRLNILLADELPEDMTGKQDTQHICGNCAWYSCTNLESICRRTGREVAYFATRECFTTEKDTTMEENTNAQPVAESTGTQVCKECGRTLPLEDFQRRRYGKRDKVCKACRAEKIRVGMATGKEKKIKVDIPEKIAKAVSAPSPASEVVLEEAVKTEGEEIAQLCRYLVEFKMAGLALWGMMPGKEEDIDHIIEAEWIISCCHEIFAAAAELKLAGAEVVPTLVAKRIYWAEKFIEELGEAFYSLAHECDTSTRKEKPSAEDVLTKAGLNPYKDGNMWCILAGDNLQEGLCGFGDTIEDALYEFLIDVLNTQREQKPLTTEETELNSIAFLEQMGYTCIPPGKEQKPAESRKRDKPKESWISRAKYEIEHADELLMQSQEELKEIRELKKQEQKPICDIASDDAIESCMLRYLQSAANRKDDIEIIEDTKAYKSELISIIKKEQKPVEWSEEDKEMLTELLLTIEPSDNYDEMRNWLLLKLKSLLLQGSKDSLQTHWKPSEEQKEALEYVIRDYREDCCNATANYLQEILDHLKNM